MWARPKGLPSRPDQHKFNQFVFPAASDVESQSGSYKSKQKSTSSDKRGVHIRLTTRSRSSSPLSKEVDSSKKKSQKSWISVWILEILGIVLSLGCNGAIVGVLYSIDGKPLHAWRLIGVATNMTPNALLQILSTVSKVSMLYAVTQGLGQLKWRYFKQRPRRLHDLQIFDDATRGPNGALNLLWKIHFRAGAALFGAIIIILALAIEVLIQQVLTFPSVGVVAGNMTASVTYTKAYTADLTDIAGQSPQADYQAMYNSFKRGIYGYDSVSPLNVFCESGNCTFAPFETLGLCPSCNDVSHLTTVECTNYEPTPIDGGLVGRDDHAVSNETEQMCNYTSPSGHVATVIWHTAGTVAPSYLIGSATSTQFASFVDGIEGPLNGTAFNVGMTDRGSIMNYTSIAINPNSSAWQVALLPNGKVDYSLIVPVVTECAWDWCVQRYDTVAYRNGSTIGTTYQAQPLEWDCATDVEQLLDKCVGVPTDKPWPEKLTSNDLPFGLNSTSAEEITRMENVYAVTGVGMMSQMGILSGLINGTLGNGTSSEDAGTDLQSFSLANNGNVSQTLRAMASSFNQMLLERSTQVNTMQGGAWTAVTLVAVNWPLLIYPAVLPILAAAFLIVAITTSAETPLWKSSVMALLYHGFDHHDAEHNLDDDHDRTMDKVSRATQVSLDRRSGILRLIKSRNLETVAAKQSGKRITPARL